MILAALTATVVLVTAATARGGTGSRARASSERPPRCERPKVENGRPCKRGAGAGTDHPGVGPCATHDDGSWVRPSFAENVEAREAFLEAVRSIDGVERVGIRSLIEPLGYKRRDVTRLLEADPEFEEDYVEARGFDVDAIRSEIAARAFDRDDPASPRLLEFLGKMRLPEAQALQRTRIDGRLEVAAVSVQLAFEPSFRDAPSELPASGPVEELEP